MAEEMNLDQAKAVIEGGMTKAQEVLSDPNQMDELLAQIQDKAKDLPATVGSALAQIPTMASMVKSYVTQECTEISPKVVVSVVSALLYLVKGKDIIPDNIPILGLVDDVAVMTVAMKICEPELNAYKAWQKMGASAPASFEGAGDVIDVLPLSEV